MIVDKLDKRDDTDLFMQMRLMHKDIGMHTCLFFCHVKMQENKALFVI